ncbi:gamma-glutamyltransferase family protein [Sinorhizobium sp. BG8]|uniref:gamma-glutamyltransferase family protein n=1 Tax=Sinorhizobium sp. BG8 TaxID=2613773 RepID=UPI00193E575B|nr:gamma-glutamyltransferase family protein [Sinorhizobium sp. BG8]QRM57955.1 gamma-glutamyltransferase family protein [Sinorhizobium sp. BG8]
MVTSPHARASEAGAAVLRRGGNAIEALVAAGASLSVLYPHFCGLGGDAVWMVADRGGDVSAYLGIGQAGERVEGISEIAARGPGSALTTACLVDSWDALLSHSAARWNGNLTLATLLEDAIGLAEEGFEVSPSQRFWHAFRRGESSKWPGFDELFVADGIQRQPQLAQTLEAIGRQGPREFYEGELAVRLAQGLAAAGSPLTAADLAKTRTKVEKPLSLTYRDHTLFAPPPPTQGATTLAIMGVLQHLSVSNEAPDSAQFYHCLIEAVKQAFLDRQRIADPDFAEVDTAGLLDCDRLVAKAKSVDPARAMSWPHAYRQGDTAFLAAVDAQGRSACVLQSIYYDWGSGVVVGDTGVLWQNRGSAFSLDPHSPNRLEPGKRPFYTLNPGIALKNGRPHLVYGTQGADGQPQTLALLLSLLIDHGLDPAAALSRPRFLLGKTFSDRRDTLKLEENLGSGCVDALSEKGHEVALIDAFSQLGGQAGIIRIADDGGMDGAHDPRSDGCAIGL